MQLLFSNGRIPFVVLLVLLSVVAFLTLGDEPNSAQEAPKETPRLKARFEEFAKADVLTTDIRDRSKEIVRVQLNSLADRDKAAKLGRIVQDFGSSVIVARNKSANVTAQGLELQKIDTTINLPGAKFEPVENPPAETVQAPGAENENGNRATRGYYIVQLGGFATDEWLDSIKDAGVEIVQYVPHQAFFVHGEGAAIAKIAGHSRVRWVGEYKGEHKVSKDVKDFASNAAGEMIAVDVATFSREDLYGVAGAIGGRILSESRLPNNFFNVVRVEIARSEVDRVASIPGVFRIDPYVKPVAEDERSSHIIAGNYTSSTAILAPGYNPLTQFGADGTGVTVMVSDDGISIPGNGGFYITSANTVDGPLRGATAGAGGGHGHINASIIAGSTPFGTLDGSGYNYGLGVAPKANIVNIPFLKSGNTTTDAQAVNDALTTLGPNGVRATISNNSWGAATNSNSYDSFAALYDGLVRDGSSAGTLDPFTIIFSAGNCGTASGTACAPVGGGPNQTGLTRPKVAKNIISVGNSENLRPEFQPNSANNIEDLIASSSRGPAADGRVKPDILAPGSAITGSQAGGCSSVSSCFDANHAWSTGTSHAAPQVAGAAALFTQYWRNSHSGAYPNPSLIKAAVISSGQESAGNITVLSTIPNGNEGWGRMNMKLMMNTGVPMFYVNEEQPLSTPGESDAFSGTVGDASKPIRVSLVWTDPPGAGDPALVNNLDLTVTVGGNTYRGNVFSGGNSTTGGSANTLDNVENVFLPAGIPAGTPFTITINATTLNGDGVIGNADATDQHYSLVVYNFAQTPPNTSVVPPADFDGDDKTDISIFRPGDGTWWINRSSNGSTIAAAFGDTNDIQAPADFTGDGKADIAFFRPSNGFWYVIRSEDSSFYAFPFGGANDTPVPGDYDADGKADAAVFRASEGNWYIVKSSGGIDILNFGAPGDRPVPGDYDGDAKTDLAIFRPSSGQWWMNRSTAGVLVYAFGSSTDKTVQGDYTGDGKVDVAFWRPTDGFWFVIRSEDSSFYAVPFGTTGDLPVPGDYDGDGKSDTAVFRPSNATWYVQRSTAGTLIQGFGVSTDEPVPNVFVR